VVTWHVPEETSQKPRFRSGAGMPAEVASAAELCQILPRPVPIPKQLGLGVNKTCQQLCFQFNNKP
jgi:hypothetical protein